MSYYVQPKLVRGLGVLATVMGIVFGAVPEAVADKTPELVGRTLSDIVDPSRSIGGYELVVENVPAVEPIGRVMLQIPAPGSEMSADRKIFVRVSVGIVVPSLINLTDVAAHKQLEALGVFVEQTERNGPGIKKGIVFDQVPKPGATIDASRDVVFLTVSSSPSIPVPGLAGVDYRDATKRLSDIGFIGVMLQTHDLRPTGSYCSGFTYYSARIVSTEPVRGDRVPLGSRIGLNSERYVTRLEKSKECSDDSTYK